MGEIRIILPKLGESIAEATITKWLKQVGDTVEVDEAIVEIATDKVDSEVPSTHEGVIKELLFEEGDVPLIGAQIAVLEVAGAGDEAPVAAAPKAKEEVKEVNIAAEAPKVAASAVASDRFYSPLVMNIARTEGIAMAELETVPGTGNEGRVTKSDILSYLKNRGTVVAVEATPKKESKPSAAPVHKAPAVRSADGDEIIEMDRITKLISDHMVMSKRTSAHITSFVEADVTNLVNWRNSVKNDFLKREGQKITFTPIFIEAVAKALVDFPMVNVSVDGGNIIKRKHINVGMATALPNGNLIVPVIKNANEKNLLGITKAVNDLATRARANKLMPDDIQGGTYTLTNVGTFGNVMGTPIINQPEVAIMAVGAIRKKPAVIETPSGDAIAIRHMMYLSHTYDHRVVNGALGGMFVRRVADYLEQWDVNQKV